MTVVDAAARRGDGYTADLIRAGGGRVARAFDELNLREASDERRERREHGQPEDDEFPGAARERAGTLSDRTHRTGRAKAADAKR